MRVKINSNWRSSPSESTVTASPTQGINRQTLHHGIAVKNNDEISGCTDTDEETPPKTVDKPKPLDKEELFEVENSALIIQDCRRAFLAFIQGIPSRTETETEGLAYAFGGQQQQQRLGTEFESIHSGHGHDPLNSQSTGGAGTGTSNSQKLNNFKVKDDYTKTKTKTSCQSSSVEVEVGLSSLKMTDPNNSVIQKTSDQPSTLLRSRSRGQMIDWDLFLQNERNLCCIAPVEFFVNAPLANIWKQLAIPGVMIELRNPFVGSDVNETEIYWLARVVHFAGYKALVKFEDMNAGTNSQQFIAWISFCSLVPKYVGWCADHGKELNAGQIVSSKLGTNIFLAELVKFFANPTPTIARDHSEKIMTEIESMVPFKLNQIVEAIDQTHPHRCRLAIISCIVGDRMCANYLGEDNDNENGLWCSFKCDMIHPIGWSSTVGVTLVGRDAKEFRNIETEKENNEVILHCNNFPEIPLVKGMRLEARHPLFPYRIVGAIIKKVLKYGYFIVETRESRIETRVKYIVHLSSPFIYPEGWSENWRINKKTEFCPKRVPFIHEPLNLHLLPKRDAHEFRVGLKLEAFQHHNPSNCVPATIIRTAEHMLLLQYDSLDPQFEGNYSWEDPEISNIYPVGYSEVVGLNFEGQVL